MNKLQDIFYFQRHTLEPVNINGKDLLEVSVKSGVYFLLGYGLGMSLNRILPEYDETKSDTLILFEIFYTAVLMGVLVYLSTILLEFTSKALVGPTICNKYYLLGLMIMLPLFSVQTEFKKKISHFLNETFTTGKNVEQYKNDEEDEEEDEDTIMKVEHNPQNNSTDERVNVDTLQRELQVPGQANQGNLQYHKDNHLKQQANNQTNMYQQQSHNQQQQNTQQNGCGCGSTEPTYDEGLESRVNGYCASSDQSCNGQWTDTKIKNEMLGGFGGLVATSLGAPLM